MIGRVVAVAVALTLVAASCRRGEASVAELAEILAGAVEWGRADGALGPAARRQRFGRGDRVRTSADGSARIELTAGGGLLLGPATTIQFGEARAVAVDGEVAADGDVVLDLDIGTTTLAAGTRVRVRGGEAGGFEVLVGRAVVTQAGEAIELGPGDRLEVEVGSSRIRRLARAPAAVAAPAGAAAPIARAAVDPASTIGATVRGRVRARTPGGAALGALKEGRHELAGGTALELARGARLELARGDERATIAGPAALVVLPADGSLFDAGAGDAVIGASSTDVVVTVPGGRLVVRGRPGDGSRVDLEVSRAGTRIEVALGAAELELGDAREHLALGETVELDRAGRLARIGRPPEAAVFALDAGIGATIHDPSPPTDVRIRFAGACPGAGVIEVDEASARRRTRGEGSAIVRLERGALAYRLRCIVDDRLARRPVASGRLTVTRDAGTRPVPATSPRNTVDADGRRYTVLYQSRLPALSFRWPGAPAATRYVLEVKPARGRRITQAAGHPTIDLPAGRLAEGSYTYLVRAGAAASRRSTLSIGFDNAASSAYVSSPRPDQAWAARVAVAGATTEGWTVALDGAPIGLDRQLRFATEVPAPTGQTGLAVEFRHPTRGTHYYVRRPAR